MGRLFTIERASRGEMEFLNASCWTLATPGVVSAAEADSSRWAVTRIYEMRHSTYDRAFGNGLRPVHRAQESAGRPSAEPAQSKRDGGWRAARLVRVVSRPRQLRRACGLHARLSCPTITLRRHAKISAEYSAEMALSDEAKRERNLRQGQLILLE